MIHQQGATGHGYVGIKVHCSGNPDVGISRKNSGDVDVGVLAVESKVKDRQAATVLPIYLP